MPGRHKEIAVEASSEQHLLAAGGYVKDDRNAFDRARALDAGVFLSFIRETQPKEWAYLENVQKEKAETTLLDTLHAKVRDSIATLREHHSALISAAVTGNMDVRKEVA